MADPTTPNLGLTLPVPHENPWNVLVNGNWDLIDSFAATVVLLNPTAGQTVTQPATTYLSVNGLQVFGTLPILPFGVAAGAFGVALSMPSTQLLSVDGHEAGDAAGNLQAGLINAGIGFQVFGEAPAGYLLVGDGTQFRPSATLPAGLGFYQTVQQAASSLTQRGKLNFLAPLTAADDAGNGSSDIGLAASGVTPGSYAAASITVDSFGRVTAAAASTLSRTVNSNGYYIRFPDGTLLQGGAVNVAATGTYFNTASVTYPTPFTSVASPVVTTVGEASSPSSDGTTPPAVQIQTASLTGFSAFMARTVVASAGGGNFDNAITMNWIAFGF